MRRALRSRLEEHGYRVASDSHGLRSELYIMGEHDLARALFEFKSSAAEAWDTMYRGSWLEGMPPRFAVLTCGESDSGALEMLEQIRVVPIFFETRDGGVESPGLDRLLAEHLTA